MLTTIEQARNHLALANPNCSAEYLFGQITKAFALLDGVEGPPALSSDDYIHAAQEMERKGLAERNLGGHHAGYMGETYFNLARAYFYADSSNQRWMRAEFDATFRKFLAVYKVEQASLALGLDCNEGA